MEVKLKYDPASFAAAVRPALGESIQDKQKAVIALDPTGENPADEVGDSLVPVLIGSNRSTTNALYRRDMFPNGIMPQHDGFPVLVEIRNQVLQIVEVDAERAAEWYDSQPPGTLEPPQGLIPTEDIYDRAITSDKIADNAVTASKLMFVEPEDTDAFNPPRRVIWDYETGELSYIKTVVADSVLPTPDDDADDDFRYGSRWIVSGGVYVLHFECLDPEPSAAKWHPVNPRHHTDTVAPSSGADIDSGFVERRSTWYNSATDTLYICISHAIGSAVWKAI